MFLCTSVPSGGCPSLRRRRSRAQASEVDPLSYFLPSKATGTARLAGSADGTAHSSSASKSHREGVDVIGRTHVKTLRRAGDFSRTAARSYTTRRRRQGPRQRQRYSTYFIEHKL